MNGRTHISSLKQLWVVTDLQPYKKNLEETLSLRFEDEGVIVYFSKIRHHGMLHSTVTFFTRKVSTDIFI